MILKIAVGLIFLALIVTGGYFIWQRNQSFPLGPAECEECGRVKKEVTWEECIKIPGAVIMESYPEKCSAPDGIHATRPISVPKGLPSSDSGQKFHSGSQTFPIWEDSANWEKFIDSKYAYQIDYPSNFEVNEGGRMTWSLEFLVKPLAKTGFYRYIEIGPNQEHVAINVEVWKKDPASVKMVDFITSTEGYYFDANGDLPARDIDQALTAYVAGKKGLDAYPQSEFDRGETEILVYENVSSLGEERIEVGAAQIGTLIYSTFVNKPDSKWFYTITAFIPTVDYRRKASLDTIRIYKMMVESFKIL